MQRQINLRNPATDSVFSDEAYGPAAGDVIQYEFFVTNSEDWELTEVVSAPIAAHRRRSVGIQSERRETVFRA